MNVVVNGEKHSFDKTLSLKELIEALSLNPKSVVVELNRNIIAKEHFDSIYLKDGDKLEIVHFVGGG